MSTTSLVAGFAPKYTTQKYGQHITYGFKELCLKFYDKNKLINFVIYEHELLERHSDDVKPLTIKPNRGKDRWRCNQLTEFIKKYGDTVQFECHEAYILWRCNMNELSLTDYDTYFDGFYLEQQKKEYLIYK